jgi:hypothetical protein
MKRRYCDKHQEEFGHKCAVKTCKDSSPAGFRTCEAHRSIEIGHFAKAKGMFQLRDRLSRQRQRGVQLNVDSKLAGIDQGHCQGYVNGLDGSDVDDDDEVEVEMSASGGTKGGEVKAVFGRLRTNKEVVAEMSCGVMIGRGTFYASEAPAGVVVSVPLISISWRNYLFMLYLGILAPFVSLQGIPANLHVVR